MLKLIRILIVACGICSIGWAISSFSANRAESLVSMAAADVLHGDKFSQEQLNQVRRQLDGNKSSRIPPFSLQDIATARLRLVEDSTTPSPADIDAFEKALAAAVAVNPNSSFIWLMEYRLENLRNGDTDRALQFLRMSYSTGPNEGWIAIRREPAALRNFAKLSPEFADQVLAEFRLVVRSWYHTYAAEMIAGPGWPIHERLLGALVSVNEPNLRAFAKVLDSKELDNVQVPGIEPRPTSVDNQPIRPF